MTDVAHDTFMGIDVNEFSSRTMYGIFNDPNAPEFASLDASIRDLVLDVPVYEDDDYDRVVRHLRLTNEDRAKMFPPRGPAVLRSQVTLQTKWRDEEV